MMDLHARIVAVVADAASPKDALSGAIRVTAETFAADAGIVFVSHPSEGLAPRAVFGDVEPAATTAVKALAERAIADRASARSESFGFALAAVPVARINRSVGAIALLRTRSSEFTTEELMRLSGVASDMLALIESTHLIETIEGREGCLGADDSAPPPSRGERILRGIPAAPGIAIGAAAFRHTFPRQLVRRETTYLGRGAEAALVRDAFEKTRNDLVRLQSAAASEIGEEQALIFGAHLMLLGDPLFTGLVDTGIADGTTAAMSIETAFDEILRRLRGARDPYVQERIEDVDDLRSRILGHVVGVERSKALGARVVVSLRTTPSLIVELKGQGALGIASELGGATSHGAVLARALGVPAVTGIDGLTNAILAGDPLVIDGDRGLVVVRPTAETTGDYARRQQAAQRKRTEFLKYRDQPTTTADGLRFSLQANIALGVDLEIARENHADGIGLYRTEFPFIVRDGLPSIEEQVRIYAKAYDAFPDGPITFRLLDLAGDKFLPYSGVGGARDAFHGYRSIRILFDYPHVLRDQVQAFVTAAAGRPVRILIPMVTCIEDVVRIKHLVASALGSGSEAVTYGAMIETPAAVELTRDLAREVEFFSIGTNDLIQYTLVIDREDPRLSSPRDACHPAVLRMIRRVVTGAHETRRRVTVCGEMAARPELAILLLAMGIDALSVTPRVIPEIKRALAHLAVEPLRTTLDAVLAASSAEEIETTLRRYGRERATDS